MTTSSTKPAFSSLRVAAIACVFLSGVGTAGVMRHLSDMPGNASAVSCEACRVTVLTSPRDMDQVNTCSPVITKMAPLLAAATHSAAMEPSPAQIEWQVLAAQSLAWQHNPDAWARLPVRF